MLGAINEHSCYFVKYTLISLFQDFYSTFHIAYSISTYSYFRKTSSQHFSGKGTYYVQEDTNIKSDMLAHFGFLKHSFFSWLIPVRRQPADSGELIHENHWLQWIGIMSAFNHFLIIYKRKKYSFSYFYNSVISMNVLNVVAKMKFNSQNHYD